MPGGELAFSELVCVNALASIGEFPTTCGDDRQPGDAVAVASGCLRLHNMLGLEAAAGTADDALTALNRTPPT